MKRFARKRSGEEVHSQLHQAGRSVWRRGAIAALCAVTLSACNNQGGTANAAAAAAAAPLPSVGVSLPVKQRVTDFDEFNGRITAVNTANVIPRVSGFLAQAHFKEGDVVKAGTVLFTLDAEPFELEVRRALGELARAQTTLQLAANNAERAARLVATEAISKEEFDTLSKAREQSQASLQVAQATVQVARLNVEYTRVRAPISGRVGRMLTTQGNLVTGGTATGTLLTTIVSLDPVHVLFDADENVMLRYQRLAREGSRVGGREEPKPVFVALADEVEFKHQGTLDFIDNQLDAKTGTLKARGVLRNPEGRVFSPGMFARVRLPGSGEYDALLVDDRAILTDQGRRIVMTLAADDTVVPKVVRLGPMHGGLRVVRAGLTDADRVVVSGMQRVRPGVKAQGRQVAMQPAERPAAAPAAAAPASAVAGARS
jgi:membrane fusion protein, multidrug efflux system